MIRQINRTLLRSITEQYRKGPARRRRGVSGLASSQSLAKGSSEQAASLEETSASTEEINAMARKNSGRSRSRDFVAQSQRS